MKRLIYKTLVQIPVVGKAIKAFSEPLQITGSWAKVDGTSDECVKLIKDYLEKHPNEQVTRQLIDRLMNNGK